MPKVSKQSATQVEDHGPVQDRHEDVGDYTINFVSFRQGDAFYTPPGHIPVAEAGAEFVQFSPSLELQAVAAAMLKNMQAAPLSSG